MNIAIFGSGPMPVEPQFPVMAPGSRTWQIAATAVSAFGDAGPERTTLPFKPLVAVRSDGAAGEGAAHHVLVLGLETGERTDISERDGVAFSCPATDCEIRYLPFDLERFRDLATEGIPMLPQVDAVIGCASVQPCATAAEFARRRGLPVWIDLFGDPVSEIQSKAELHAETRDANEGLLVHIWKLLLPALLQGDRFSALSERQRYALIGQLGAAGRLNRRNRWTDLVATIPYGIPPVSPGTEASSGEASTADADATFTVMWSGSFNTWMDVGALVEGDARAVREEPKLRLLVVGGRIPGYNEVAYEQFVSGVREAGVEHAIEFADWRPLRDMAELYERCDVGLSIDRFTYEAVLGSRTRIVNFLAAAKPVISTVITELTEELSREGYVLPFKAGDGADLARALIEAGRMGHDGARELGLRGRDFILRRFDALAVGERLADWVREPRFAPDKDESGLPVPDNPLREFWEAAPK